MTRTTALERPVDLIDPDAFTELDQGDYWRAVRAEEPVGWHGGAGGRPGFWVVARHREVLECYRNTDVLSSQSGTVLDVMLAGPDSAGGRMLAVTDRPRHRQLRAALWPAFSAAALRPVAGQVRDRVRGLIGQWRSAGEFDFAVEVAEQVPLNTICDLLDVPVADRPALLRWNKLALSAGEGGDDPDGAAIQARNEIVFYFLDLALDRRGGHGSDVVSTLANAVVEGELLTPDEVALNCYSVLLGGDESSRFSAVCAIKALAEAPEQWSRLRAGAIDPDRAVEEILRWATPAKHFARTATADLRIGDQQVRAGQIVSLWNISANFDERSFDRPDRLDLDRHPNWHVAFGHGPHFCPGAMLGRIELRALLDSLIESVATIELCGRPEPVRSNFLNGYCHLPVRLHAT